MFYNLKTNIKLFYFNKIIKGIKKLYPSIEQRNSKKILFHLVRTLPQYSLLYFEGIIAHALNIRGADTSMLICDNVLLNCGAGTIGTGQKSFCQLCKPYRERIIQSIGLPVLSYREFINDKKIDEIVKMIDKLDYNQYEKFIYRGVKVGFSAKTSVIRYFQKGIIEDNIQTRNKFKECLINASIVTEVAESIYNRIKPDLIVTLHGIYSTWEPFYLYFKNKGVNVIVYGLCAAELHTVRFLLNGRDFESIGVEYWSEKKALTSKENLELDKFLEGRFSFKRGLVSIFNKNINRESPKDIIERIVSSNYRRRFALFTNLPWDSALIAPDRIFKHVFTWVFETIKYFNSHPDYQLIIKVHPVETIEKDTYPFLRIIKEKFPELPKNIFILPPNTPVKPYDLFDIIDAGIVYNGTLGLEMAIKGVPVLVAGSSAYTEKEGVVYKIKNKEEYFYLIEHIDKIKNFSKEHIDIARKYAYLYFIKSEIPICFFKENKWAEIDWFKLRKLRKILKEDIYINHLCYCMLNNKEILRLEEN